MSKCLENDKHTFTFILSRTEGDFEIYQYITCITCGERRAVTNTGRLLFWDSQSEAWVIDLPKNSVPPIDGHSDAPSLPERKV